MTKHSYWLTLLALIALIVYLFVEAPAPLPEKAKTVGKTHSVETVFKVVAAENDAVRTLWTGEIVGKGKKAGLDFSEEWRDNRIQAGPLPALFLREAASALEKHVIRLSLFLGSDYPINPSNLFKGQQKTAFEAIKKNHQPQFFYTKDTGLHTAMFPDYSSVQPCVSCHNDHPDSPKTDWKINDVMGATTWSYPDAEVTLDQLMAIIKALRGGFRTAYNGYLEKVATFDNPPEIGERWPQEGYYLPSLEFFMAEFERRASPTTVALLLETGDEGKTTMKEKPATERLKGETDRAESDAR